MWKPNKAPAELWKPPPKIETQEDVDYYESHPHPHPHCHCDCHHDAAGVPLVKEEGKAKTNDETAASSDKTPAKGKGKGQGHARKDSRQPYVGRRVAQIVRLKPEFADRYREVHSAVWPEVLRQIRECNIRDYSIAHDPETNLLFASFKYVGFDYAGDMEKMRENAKVREWWAMTDGFQESLVPGAKSSEAGEPAWWKEIDEVFYTP